MTRKTLSSWGLSLAASLSHSSPSSPSLARHSLSSLLVFPFSLAMFRKWRWLFQSPSPAHLTLLPRPIFPRPP